MMSAFYWMMIIWATVPSTVYDVAIVEFLILSDSIITLK